ncbi:MAG: hypothetical protein RI954_53, partial [Actinomycetota bacterium]
EHPIEMSGTVSTLPHGPDGSRFQRVCFEERSHGVVAWHENSRSTRVPCELKIGVDCPGVVSEVGLVGELNLVDEDADHGFVHG